MTFYERMGFMHEAMLNYLGRMGWSMPDEREKFTLAEMIEHFDISRVSLGGPIFDLEKLSWLNGQWLRELPVETFAAEVQKWALNPEYLMKIAPHVQGAVIEAGVTPMIINWLRSAKPWLYGGRQETKFIQIAGPGDTLTYHGKVIEKTIEGDKKYVWLDIHAENQKGEKVMVGRARVAF